MQRFISLLFDLILVFGFAIAGRASHGEGLDFPGILTTAWPFMVACIAGWVVLFLLDDSGLTARAGLIVWLSTWLGGIGIRVISGDTAAATFVAVAGGMLALLLIGWRLVLLVWRRFRTASPSQAAVD